MNYLLAVMESVCNSIASGSNQQLADGNMTVLDVNIEQSVYNQWTSNVQRAEKSVNSWAQKVAANPTNKGYQAQLTAAQTNFQNTETQEQTYTQQSDSATQAMQNQTGQDSATMQMKVQLEAAINQVAQTLSSALAQHL